MKIELHTWAVAYNRTSSLFGTVCYQAVIIFVYLKLTSVIALII